MLTDIGSIQVCLCSPWWKRINFPSRAGEGYHHAAWAPFGSNILQNVTPLSCLDVLTITCLLLSFFNLKRQQCLFNVCCSVSSTPTMFSAIWTSGALVVLVVAVKGDCFAYFGRFKPVILCIACFGCATRPLKGFKLKDLANSFPEYAFVR